MLNPFLTKLIAEARIADLHMNASRYPARTSEEPRSPAGGNPHKEETVTIRVAGPADGRMLTRLAQLDSAVLPKPPFLIAEIDGVIHAALSLHDGTVIANPLHRTLTAQHLLLTRAAQLRGNRRASWPQRLLNRAKARARTASSSAAVSGALPNPTHRRTA